MGELINLKVTKSNELIEAGYKLTLNEQRLILAAIAQIDSRKPIKKDLYFKIKSMNASNGLGCINRVLSFGGSTSLLIIIMVAAELSTLL